MTAGEYFELHQGKRVRFVEEYLGYNEDDEEATDVVEGIVVGYYAALGDGVPVGLFNSRGWDRSYGTGDCLSDEYNVQSYWNVELNELTIIEND